jgi:hypothetical protein
MAFMFKGPASLTSGSVVTDATSISSADLTVTDDLTVTNDVTVGDDLTVTGDIVASTITAKINESVVKLTSAPSGVYPDTDISNTNVLYLANTDNSTATQTLRLSWSSVLDGHHIFIAWVARNTQSPPTSIKVTFGTGSGNNTIYAGTGTAGPNAKVITLNGLGTNALFYYSSDLLAWMANESNAAVFSTS